MAKILHRHKNKIAHLVVLVILAAGFALAAWLNTSHYESERPTTSNNVASQDFYKSLDLSQARQAVYTNQPIRQVRDLGVKDRVKHFLVSSGVPAERE